MVYILALQGFEKETRIGGEPMEKERRHTPYTKFKAFLEEIGVKQRDLALMLNKTPSALNQNLNGTGGDFSLSEVRFLCQKFNISADEFFISQKVSKMKPSANPEKHLGNQTA